MMPLALGLAVVAALLWAATSFARASVASIKALGAWIAALAGLSLVALLLLTGRGALATSGLVLAGPLAWSWWQQHRRGPGGSPGSSPGGGPGGRGGPNGRAGGPAARLTRTEAYSILGLPDGASDADIQAAWVRLMRAVHPDGGGTDWLAARVNQARDVLLRR